MNRIFPHDSYYRSFSTPLGAMIIVWGMEGKTPRVLRLLLSQPDRPAARRLESSYPAVVQPDSTTRIDQLVRRIKQYAEGWKVRFSLEDLYWPQCTDFQIRVLQMESRVPRGRVTSYRQIARGLGKPGAARGVGQALARNPFPIIIPCHRCVRSDGSLGGFQGGEAMKARLLQMEGVVLDRKGRVAGGVMTHGFQKGKRS